LQWVVTLFRLSQRRGRSNAWTPESRLMKAVRSIPANHSLVATLFYLRSIEALDVQCLLPALGAISLGSKPWPNHESAVRIRCENLLLIEIWPPRLNSSQRGTIGCQSVG